MASKNVVEFQQHALAQALHRGEVAQYDCWFCGKIWRHNVAALCDGHAAYCARHITQHWHDAVGQYFCQVWWPEPVLLPETGTAARCCGTGRGLVGRQSAAAWCRCTERRNGTAARP
jgi:hypothetical protein